MSYTGLENELLPEERQHECSDCGFMKFAENFNRDDNYDIVCNDCYEDQRFMCGSCGEWCDEYTYNEEKDIDECNECIGGDE
tara:strand:+ start:837 stop:1082 length:246 start_codon:yes stop_codon:yes gene_type:complete